MYDQIPIFIIRQKTAAPSLMRQLSLLHILYFTIISQVRTMLPAFTVMTAVPFPFAVTFPFALTVATFLFELLVDDLCLSARRCELRFDGKRFSFFQCLCRRYAIDAGLAPEPVRSLLPSLFSFRPLR